MTKYKINLEDYRTKGSKVFTGRPSGKRVRESSRIDIIEKSNDLIEIIIPDDIYSVNPSFLEEFLVNIVTKLGKASFEEKFKFINDGPYKIKKDLDEAVERILREENALV